MDLKITRFQDQLLATRLALSQDVQQQVLFVLSKKIYGRILVLNTEHLTFFIYGRFCATSGALEYRNPENFLSAMVTE